MNTTSDRSVFVSIQLNSNRPAQFMAFLDSVEATAEVPEKIEVLVHIDQGDDKMVQTVGDQILQRRLHLRFLQTDMVKSFFDLWKPLNRLYRMTADSAYFIINVSDEFHFRTRGWDTHLQRYIGYYPDHIFRIRASRYRFRNYTDLWECGFAPDSLAFYTKRWLDIVGDWNPCMGPDSFQQCVAFYLSTADRFNKDHIGRDIPDPFLQFSGEGANVGLEGKALEQRVYGHIKAWFELMSPTMQLEAKRRAMLLKARIWVNENKISSCSIVSDKALKKVIIKDRHHEEITSFDYKVNPLKIRFVNYLRRWRYHYFTGGGEQADIRSLWSGLMFYLSYRYTTVRWIRHKIARTWLGRLFIELNINRKLRIKIEKQLRIFMSQFIASDQHYYLYGTGNFACAIVRIIDKHGYPLPESLIEKNSMMISKKDLHHPLNQLAMTSEDEAVSRLTEKDIILIGSFNFADAIKERLDAKACTARKINFCF